MPSIWSCVRGRDNNPDGDLELDEETMKAVQDAIAAVRGGDACLSLTGRMIGDELCETLAEALPASQSLRWLQLDRNMLGDAAALALSRVLSGPEVMLQSLDLDFNRIRDAGAGHLAEALEVNSSLKDLQLHCNAIGPAGAAKFAKALRANKTLRTLSLHGNATQDSGAAAFAKALETNSTLRTLSLHGTGICDEGAKKLSNGLQSNSTLRELSLGGNFISDVGAASLGEMLKVSNSLQELQLNDNRVGDEGACALARSMEKNQSIRDLWLLNNPVSVVGVRAFAKALEENTTLSWLGLTADHEAIEEESLRALQRSHTMRKALMLMSEGSKQLCIAGSEFNEKGISRLAQAIQRSGTLSFLRLDGCAISDNGAEILAEALEENTSLAQVSLVNNNIGDAGATRLAAVLKRNNTLENLDLDGNPITDDVSTVISTPRLTTPRTWRAISHQGSSKITVPVCTGGSRTPTLNISKMNADAFRAMSAVARRNGESSPGGEDRGFANILLRSLPASPSLSATRACGFLDDVDDTRQASVPSSHERNSNTLRL